MSRWASTAWVLALLLSSAAACQAPPTVPPGLPGTQVGPDTAKLLEALGAAGATFTPAKHPPVPAPYLRAPVTAVDAGDDSLAIWEYPNPDAAADDSRRISSRGVDGGFMELGSEARWFRRDRLLVLYLGTDARVRSVLVRELGQTFVGPVSD